MKQSLTMTFLALLSTAAAAQEAISAKSLFFDTDNAVVSVATGPVGPSAAGNAVVASAKPTATHKPVLVASARPRAGGTPMGAAYFIRLKAKDGSTHDVLANRTFKSGERFQLAVKVNRPSYVYILNEGPDGEVRQIYPQPGADNFVNAMGTVFLPAKGSFEFDEQAGTEQMMVYLSPTAPAGPLIERLKHSSPDIVSAPSFIKASVPRGTCGPQDAVRQAASDDSMDKVAIASASGVDFAPKGISFSADTSAPSCRESDASVASASVASKAIVFSEDPAPDAGGQVASYVVKTHASSDDSLFLKLKLVHK